MSIAGKCVYLSVFCFVALGCRDGGEEESPAPIDSIQVVGQHDWNDNFEVVDVQLDPQRNLLYGCTAFGGVQVFNLNPSGDPEPWWLYGLLSPTSGGSGPGKRCFRMALVDDLDNGFGKPLNLLALSHRGDSKGAAFLRVVKIPDQEDVNSVPNLAYPLHDLSLIQEEEISYGGIDYQSGYVYATAYNQGLRIYSFSVLKGLKWVGGISDIGIANSVRVDGSMAYVADSTGRLVVVDVSEPAAPALAGAVALTGSPRDISLGSTGTLAVAAGVGGVHLVDVSKPDDPTLLGTWPTYSSSRAVAMGDGFVAVANWDDIVVVDFNDPTAPVIVAEDAGIPEERDARFLSVEAVGSSVYSGEWATVQHAVFFPGILSPEVRLGNDEIHFGDVTTDPSTRVLFFFNDGHMPLTLELNETSDAKIGVVPSSLTIAPGSAEAVEVSVQSMAEEFEGELLWASNDPDEAVFSVRLFANRPGIDLGDDFPTAHFFGNGNGVDETDLVSAPEMFEDKVTFFVYFATF